MHNRSLAFFLAVSVSTFIFISPIHSQENLISNPGFEKDSDKISYEFGHDKSVPTDFISDWTHPTIGAPDYWFGNGIIWQGEFESFPVAPAHSGKGRTGLMFNSILMGFEDDDEDDYPDFLQTKLKKPLVAGQKYYFEFYLKLDPGCAHVANDIGALFTSKAISPDEGNLKPDIVFTDFDILKDTSWHKVSGCFTAVGGENYLTVGSFKYDGAPDNHKKFHSESLHYYMKNNLSLEFSGDAYYYMDDFLLEKDSAIAKPINPHPDNVVMLVDVSRSMYEGKYMNQLKSELKDFISGEGAGTKITLVTFGSGIKVLTRAKILNDTSSIDSLLGSIEEGGATNIEQALTKGYALADSLKDPNSRTKIILFSDAEFQLNKKEEKMIRNYAKEKNIGLVVFHYGKHVNEELEKTLTKCNGHYAKAGDEELSKAIVGKEIHADNCGCD
jgi:hypothetical protein